MAQRKDRQSDEYQIRSVILRGEPAIHEITCITVDADGNIYVCDRVNGAVHKYSSQGALLSVLATGLKNPARIAVNGDGNIYVLTLGDNAVREIWKDWEGFINS